jgi:hypothetical protein
MGAATVRIDALTNAPPDFETITFGLPLCVSRAHLLHGGATWSTSAAGYDRVEHAAVPARPGA